MMFAALSSSSVDLSIGISIAYVVLVIFSIWLMRSLELRLFTLGVFTGLLAIWSDLLVSSSGANFQVQGLQGQVGGIMIGGEATRVLGRIAVILILGGVAVAVL